MDNSNEEERPVLGRTKLVNIITDYYKLLVRMYIPDEMLKIPPPEGWPQMTAESTKTLPKSMLVKSLLKHLPYISEDTPHNAELIGCIHYLCKGIDYSTKTGEYMHLAFGDSDTFLKLEMEEMKEGRSPLSDEQDDDEEGNEDDDMEMDEESDDDQERDDNSSNADSAYIVGHNVWDSDEFGAEFHGGGDDPGPDWEAELLGMNFDHIIGLGDGHGCNSTRIVLNVMTGRIYSENQGNQTNDSEPVEEYFNDMRDKLERLCYVPVITDWGFYEFCEGVVDLDNPEEASAAALDERDSWSQRYKQIYKDFGWPGAEYDKAGCMAAISNLCRKREQDEEEERTKA